MTLAASTHGKLTLEVSSIDKLFVASFCLGLRIFTCSYPNTTNHDSLMIEVYPTVKWLSVSPFDKGHYYSNHAGSANILPED